MTLVWAFRQHSNVMVRVQLSARFGFKSKHCYSLAVWPWICHLTSLSPVYLICTMGLITFWPMGIQYDEMCKGLGIVLGTWKVPNKCFYQNVCPMAQARALAVSFFSPRWQHSLPSSKVWRGWEVPWPLAHSCAPPLAMKRFDALIFQNMAMEGVYTLENAGSWALPKTLWHQKLWSGF